MTVWAVIAAAGQGKRIGGAKQFAHIAGHAVLWHAAHPFLRSAEVSHVRVVVAADAVRQARAALAEYAAQIEVLPLGGSTRMESVRGGLTNIADDDWVLVHDAARPCLADATLARLLAARTHADGALLALPVREALKHAGPPLQTLSKQEKFLAQTPQMFRAGMLRRALDLCAAARHIADDESQAMEQAGYAPLLVAGEAANIKITDTADFALAETILMQRRQTAAAA